MANQYLWHAPASYQIKIKGKLGSEWLDWFSGITIVEEGGFSTLSSNRLDQSALHGLLVRIRDLGLPLISVKRIQSS